MEKIPKIEIGKNPKHKSKNNLKAEKKYGLQSFLAYKKFSKRILDSKKKLLKILIKLKNNDKKIIGYGATAKSCTVLNYCNINDKIIDYFYDTTSFKINKYLPGSKIKIKKYKKLINLGLKIHDLIFNIMKFCKR